MDKTNQRVRYIALGVLVAMLIISVAVSVLLVQHRKYITDLERQGYLGLFIISVIAGSPLLIPTPAMILTFTLGSILHPFYVGLVSGLGNAAGNALVYWAGRGGHRVFRNFMITGPTSVEPRSRLGRFFSRLSRVPDFASRRVLVAVFSLALYPNPILTPLVLGMGATRFSFWRFSLTIWVGKTIQCLILSYLGYFGLRSIMRYFGIF